MLIIVFLFQLLYFIFIINKKNSIRNCTSSLNIRFHTLNQLPKIATVLNLKQLKNIQACRKLRIKRNIIKFFSFFPVYFCSKYNWSIIVEKKNK